MTADETRRIVQTVADEIRQRAAVGDWQPSDDMPSIVVEEVHATTDDGTFRDRIDRLVREGRKP